MKVSQPAPKSKSSGAASPVVRIQNRIMGAERQIWLALCDIYGIGKSTAHKICLETSIDAFSKVKELSPAQVQDLQTCCGKYCVEGDLRRKVSMDIKHLRDIGCYRGLRHRKNLPVRGQRTRTNARTRKGPGGNRVASKRSQKND